MTNADLDKGFYLKEIGLFATDPDVGEILYCVATAGDADYIQAKGGATVLSIALHMTIAIKSVDDVVTDVDTKGLVTASDLANHDKSETAHKNLLQVTAIADKPASMSDRGLWVEIKDGLKSILHRWNKTTMSYETIHPETESAQITDWHSGIMASLASKTLGPVVDAITTDSVLGKLIKMLLNASGVKYLIDTNGYICFGSFFGGLIIQWVISAQENQTNTVPLSGFYKIFETAIHKTGGTATYVTSMKDTNSNSFYIASNATGTSTSYWLGLFK